MAHGPACVLQYSCDAPFSGNPTWDRLAPALPGFLVPLHCSVFHRPCVAGVPCLRYCRQVDTASAYSVSGVGWSSGSRLCRALSVRLRSAVAGVVPRACIWRLHWRQVPPWPSADCRYGLALFTWCHHGCVYVSVNPLREASVSILKVRGKRKDLRLAQNVEVLL